MYSPYTNIGKIVPLKKSPKRTLQPQMARHFFHIVIEFLQILIQVSRTTKMTNDSAEENDVKEENDIELSDASDSDGDMEGSMTIRQAASFAPWRCSVTRLRETFSQCWPPPARESKFIKRLKGFELETLFSSRLMHHHTLSQLTSKNR